MNERNLEAERCLIGVLGAVVGGLLHCGMPPEEIDVHCTEAITGILALLRDPEVIKGLGTYEQAVTKSRDG